MLKLIVLIFLFLTSSLRAVPWATSDPGATFDQLQSMVHVGSGVLAAGGSLNGSFVYEGRIERRVYPAGTLDPGFGSGGVLVIAPDASSWIATHILPEGSSFYTVVLHSVTWTTETRLEKRDLLSGALDPGFGSAGVLTLSDAISTLASDGTHLYVLGSTGPAGDKSALLEQRDLATGALVPGFGTAGRVLSDLSANEDRFNMAGIDGGYIYLSGAHNALSTTGAGGDQMLQKRSLSDGSLAPAFGSGGILLAGPGSYGALLIDGSSLIVNGPDFGALSYSARTRIDKRSLATGAIEPGWAGGGSFYWDASSLEEHPLFLASDGSGGAFCTTLSIDGTSGSVSTVLKVGSNGALDASFGLFGAYPFDPSPTFDFFPALFVDGGSLFLGGYESLSVMNTQWRIEQLAIGLLPTYTITPTVTPTTTPGGCSGSYGLQCCYSNGLDNNSTMIAQKITLPQAVIGVSVGVSLTSYFGGQMNLAVYADAAGVPGALIASGTQQTAVMGAQTLALPSPVLPAGDVWLAVQSYSATFANYVDYDSTPGASYSAAQAYGAFPASFPVGTANSTRTFLIWLNYACGSFSPTDTPTLTPLVSPTSPPTASLSPSVSPTRTVSATVTATRTISLTFSPSPALTATPTRTPSPTPAPNSLPEAVDNLGLTFSTGGSAAWNLQTTTTYSGGDAAQSGFISDSQSTWMETTVTGPGSLSFYWRVSSESGYDYLRVAVDMVDQGSPLTGISGTWAQRTLSLAAGTHTVRWTYSKDSTLSDGSDAGWVDLVVWTPLGSPTHSPTQSPSRTISPTATHSPVVTATPTSTASPVFSPTPTFTPGGCLLLGSTFLHPPSTASSGYMVGARYTLASPMTLRSISVHNNSAGGGVINTAIYANGAGNTVGALIQSATAVSMVTGWNVCPLPDTPLAAGDYWLAVQASGTSTLGWQSGGASNTEFYRSFTYGAFPASLIPDGYQAGALSIYGSDCASGGGPTPTATRTVTATPTLSPVFSPTTTALPSAAPSLLGFWRTNGPVYAIQVIGNLVFVGGSFTQVVSPDGATTISQLNLAAFNINTGLPHTFFAGTTGGIVYALGTNGTDLFVGGSFTQASVYSQPYLAKYDVNAILTGTGTTVITSFNPVLNGTVRDFAYGAPILYVAGDFTSADGNLRNRFAAFNAITGAVTPWNPNANGSGRAVEANGASVYLGGLFTSIGSSSRSNFAEVDAINGGTTAWNTLWNDEVYDLRKDSGKLYAGGRFSFVGGNLRNGAVAYDNGTHTIQPFNPNTGQVNSLAFPLGEVVLGGWFSSTGGQPRSNLAKVNAATGALNTVWAPDPNSDVHAVAAVGSTVFVGGAFTNIMGQNRPYFAAIYDGPAFSPTVTRSATFTPSPSHTVTPTPSQTPSFTVSPTATVSPTVTPTSARPAAKADKVFSYPNPYSPGRGRVCTIVFEPAPSASLELWDWSGRRRGEVDPAKIHAMAGYAEWDGLLSGGETAPPGLYFILLKTPSGARTVKLTVVWL